MLQLYGLVFGYLMVTRLNTCQERYWEGVGLVKMMWSKWGDAVLQVRVRGSYTHPTLP